MAKKDKSHVGSDKETIAQMYGTISRVYCILGLFCEPESMQNRWEALDKWCDAHPHGVTYQAKPCNHTPNLILPTED